MASQQLLVPAKVRGLSWLLGGVKRRGGHRGTAACQRQSLAGDGAIASSAWHPAGHGLCPLPAACRVGTLPVSSATAMAARPFWREAVPVGAGPPCNHVCALAAGPSPRPIPDGRGGAAACWSSALRLQVLGSAIDRRALMPGWLVFHDATCLSQRPGIGQEFWVTHVMPGSLRPAAPAERIRMCPKLQVPVPWLCDGDTSSMLSISCE